MHIKEIKLHKKLLQTHLKFINTKPVRIKLFM